MPRTLRWPVVVAVILAAGVFGGLTVLFCLLAVDSWMLGGEPAHPTIRGLAEWTIMGGVMAVLFASVTMRIILENILVGTGRSKTIVRLEIAGLAAISVMCWCCFMLLLVVLEVPIALELD